MPFHKFDHSFQADKLTGFDYTIIGAGAAGICLAVNLSRQGKSVMLIESGIFEESEMHQRLNEVILTGKYMNGISAGRKRIVGGTTVAWGGQSLPFSPIDFKKRDWVESSGWPMTYEEIAPFYVQANQFMGLQDHEYFSDAELKKINLQNPGFNKSIFDYHISRWAKEPNFKLLYSNYLEKNVFTLYDASLDKIYSKNDKIIAIDLVNNDLHRINIHVNNLILATGGVESIRILLAHPELFSLNEQYEKIGKGFMDHPCIDIGYIVPDNAFRLQRYFNTHIYKGYKQSVRLSLNHKIQTEKKILNASASLFFDADLSNDLFTLAKGIREKFSVKNLFKLFGNIGKLPKTIYAYLFRSFIFKSNAKAIISLMIEQESTQNSYLALSDEVDHLYQRKIVVNWDITYATWKTVIEIADSLKLELERLNFGKVVYKNDISADYKEWKSLLSDVNHHMGGLRISNDQTTGVVDPDLKVWGIENLYVASAAVFPTSSHSNPTLTLLALCYRLVNHLSKK